MDLAGVDPKPARQLGYRAVLADRRKRHLRLELRTVLLPCIRHVSPPANRPFQAGLSLSCLSSFRGPPQSSPSRPSATGTRSPGLSARKRLDKIVLPDPMTAVSATRRPPRMAARTSRNT